VLRIEYLSSCTDSIKLSLQFSCIFDVINASEGSLCFQIFILHNSRCQVLFGSCKKLPRTSLQCCYIFSGPSGSFMPALLSFENSVPLLMYRLNQTESAILL
jgi:hypothetical protein